MMVLLVIFVFCCVGVDVDGCVRCVGVVVCAVVVGRAINVANVVACCDIVYVGAVAVGDGDGVDDTDTVGLLLWYVRASVM